MLTALSIALISVATIIFFSHRLLCYLHHFQAGGYSGRQFKNWVVANGIYDKKGSLIATIAALTMELTEKSNVSALTISAIAVVALIWLSVWESDPRKDKVSSLKSTRQAEAIYNLALVLYSIAFPLVTIGIYKLGAGAEIACYWILVIAAIQSSPIWLMLASTIYSWRTR
jgi:hypothetical protein